MEFPRNPSVNFTSEMLNFHHRLRKPNIRRTPHEIGNSDFVPNISSHEATHVKPIIDSGLTKRSNMLADSISGDNNENTSAQHRRTPYKSRRIFSGSNIFQSPLGDITNTLNVSKVNRNKSDEAATLTANVSVNHEKKSRNSIFKKASSVDFCGIMSTSGIKQASTSANLTVPSTNVSTIPYRSRRVLSNCNTTPHLRDISNNIQPQKRRKVINRENIEYGIKLFSDEIQTSIANTASYETLEHSEIADYMSSDDDMSVDNEEEDLEDVEKDGRNYTNANNKCNNENSAHVSWCEQMIRDVPPEYKSLGAPTSLCRKCGAIMWKEERSNKKVTKGLPKFSLCCSKGRVKLPPVRPTPPFLLSLYNDKLKGPGFRKCIRLYNSMFSFTSMGGHVDNSVNKGGAPYVYRLNGQNHHQFGSLLPSDGDHPRFCQLYIYDTQNEVGNRMRWININDTNNVDPLVVEGLLKMLDESNHLVRCFRMARDRFRDQEIVDLKIVLRASRSESGRENHISPSDEVAAVMVGDQDETCGQRDVVIDSKVDGLKRISEIHPLLMALQYPLLFPYGEDGYHEKIYYVKQDDEKQLKRETVTMREYYAYVLQIRPGQGMTLRLGGRLYQQFVVDSFSAIEQSRLWWLRCNQKTLRNELYSHICDYFKEGDGDLSNIGKGYILPSSFVGSKRYLQQNFQDALAVCRFIGHPDLFLTMTCNPMWEEVLKMMSLLPGCRPSDCPDIITRVFKLKLQQLKNDIKKKNFFGKCIAVMYVVEWQKRGLPHVHMLIWLDSDSKKVLNDNVDSFVTAEIPDPINDPSGYAAVKLFMVHGPCGLERLKSPCMKGSKCSRHFPKSYCARTWFDESGFPIYKRRKTDNVVNVRKAVLDNQWVVPFNRELLLRYQCHINVEICNRARCLKYLFKYCLKGSDRATVEITSQKNANTQKNNEEPIDEIKRFFYGRYVCGAEACHRIFAFDVHHRSVSVERLPFHLEGDKRVNYKETDQIEKVIADAVNKPSKLEAFFTLNKEDVEARQYTYDQIPQKYVWDRDEHCWTPRVRGLHIGRLCYSHHSTGELWFLRMLLSRVKGPTSYQHLRTVNGVIYNSFQEACNAYGFLDSDNEWNDCILECDKYGLPPQIRQLFVHIMVNCNVADLGLLWKTHWKCMSEDILYMKRQSTGKSSLELNDEQLQNFTLVEIDKLLRDIGKSLKNFKQMPHPPSRYLNESRNNLILEETSYDREQMLSEHSTLLRNCNPEQLDVYNGIMDAVAKRKGGVFFVYGSGGCGKTYLWKTIITRLRSLSKIVLPVASSGIAATLLPGGRTAHSRFKIPILLDELSSCDIAVKSDIAELIKKTDLIIWDEAPMQHRYAFECLDRTLRDIMKSVSRVRAEIAFGGIPILLGGDFRQILPVISRGSRSDIVSSCITRSRIWAGCKIYQLKTNMRLNRGNSIQQVDSNKQFGRWVLEVGNGKTNTDYAKLFPGCVEDTICIPDDYCISSSQKSVDDIINSTFPNLIEKFSDVSYLSERAILTPTNLVVAHINKLVLEKILGEVFRYYSTDKAEELGNFVHDFDVSFPPEYLNSLMLPGIPQHELILKEGVVVMLMRNLNQILGLCNGTRLIVRRCLTNAVQCEVISGSFVGSTHFIPRMELSPTDTRLPFHFVRRQFPLQVCYCMTINKAQGQSLQNVGLYLKKPVFTHGQFYVAISRVTSPEGLKIFIESDNGATTNRTLNVVYPEVFYNIPRS